MSGAGESVVSSSTDSEGDELLRDERTLARRIERKKKELERFRYRMERVEQLRRIDRELTKKLKFWSSRKDKEKHARRINSIIRDHFAQPSGRGFFNKILTCKDASTGEPLRVIRASLAWDDLPALRGRDKNFEVQLAVSDGIVMNVRYLPVSESGHPAAMTPVAVDEPAAPTTSDAESGDSVVSEDERPDAVSSESGERDPEWQPGPQREGNGARSKSATPRSASSTHDMETNLQATSATPMAERAQREKTTAAPRKGLPPRNKMGRFVGKK